MNEQGRVLRIVVASPGDVQAERDTVPAVVDEVNRWIASFLGLHIEVARWETDAYPGFHLDGPQGLIERVLRIEESDAVIGIFWKRFGTPTAYGTTGAEHEIRRACEAWKRDSRPQVMVYFNQKPYMPRSKQETDQWGQVLEFKSAFPAEGLWWPYKGKADFERLLRNHLMNFIRDNFLVGTPRPEGRRSTALQQFLLLPTAPGLFVGREAAMREIKRRLGLPVDDRGPASMSRLVVVRGWPGVGKSTIAAALAYDAETRKAFPEGILWISLGQNPNLVSALAAWGRALGTDDLLKAPTLVDATEKLASLLRKKQMLLIVDDVWEKEHAVPFEQARGTECTLLFTTRETKIAEAIVSNDTAIYNLPVLTEESAIELLGLLAPSVVADNPAECGELVRDLECLPLALHVAGHMLNAEAKLGWGVTAMLKDLRSGSRLLQETAPGDRTDLVRQTTPTVAALLRQSTDRLDENTRDCFASLGPFAPQPATFDLAALKAIWLTEDPRPIVRKLASQGLLEPVGNRFQMHALLVAHARSLLTE